MIKPVDKVAKKAYVQLKKYQSGELRPVKTGRPWIDSVFGGLLPQDIVTIAGASGGGKSHEEQQLKNYVMDKKNNPSADNYVWLSVALEMKFLSLMLRDMHQNLDKSKKDIISKPFTEQEDRMVTNYMKSLTDGRFFIEEEALDPIEFEKSMRAFLQQHVDKEAVFISIDHIALMKNGGSDKKGAVDGVVEAINRLKKEFPNSFWVILSQLNRNILGRIKDKDIMAMPNRGDVFQSDTMFHISDYLYVSHNPYRLGINQFSSVSPKTYDYLEEHFGEPSSNGKRVSFNTLGKIFFIILKVREAEIIFDDIFIDDIKVSNLEKHKEDDFEKEIEDPDFGSGDGDDVPF